MDDAPRPPRGGGHASRGHPPEGPEDEGARRPTPGATPRPPAAPVSSRRHVRPSAVGRVPFRVGESLARTFSYLGRYGLLVLLASALLHAPVAAWVLSAARDAHDALQEAVFYRVPPEVKTFRLALTASNLITSLFGLLLQSALAYGVYRHLQGRPAGLVESLAGLRRFLPALGAAFVVGLSVAAVIFASTMIGVLLGTLGVVVIVGGFVGVVMIYCAWFVAVQSAIVEDLGPGRAVSRSGYLTTGHRLQVFLVVLLVFGTQVAATLLLDHVVFPDQERWAHLSGALLAGFAVATLTTAFHAVVAAVLYHDLRRSREGIGVEDLLKVFE